jgi:hypothetical protein
MASAQTWRLGLLLAALLGGWGWAQVLVVSRPPAPVLPDDPPQGRIYRLSAPLDDHETYWDGGLALSYGALDAAGTAYFTYGGPEEGGLLIVPDWPDGLDAARRVAGPQSGLQDPKDLALLEAPDGLWVAVADFGTGRVSVFAAEGDVSPRFVLADLAPEGGSVWGLLYHPETRRFFVSTTDGYVLVYDDFPARRGADGPDRVILPTHAGAKASANLHGVAYDASSDTLVVTDVGPSTTPQQGADFAANGVLFVIGGASAADGPTPVRARLAGPATLLGNPVDVVLGEDGAAYIAEKANDLVLRFEGVLAWEGAADRPPDGAISLPAPEGLFPAAPESGLTGNTPHLFSSARPLRGRTGSALPRDFAGWGSAPLSR